MGGSGRCWEAASGRLCGWAVAESIWNSASKQALQRPTGATFLQTNEATSINVHRQMRQHGTFFIFEVSINCYAFIF